MDFAKHIANFIAKADSAKTDGKGDSSSSEGRWVTIGSGKSKSGTHVFINPQGKILKGAKSLVGRQIDALHEDTEYGQKAKEAKVDYKVLRQLGAEILAHDREFTNEKAALIKAARDAGEKQGVNLSRGNPAFQGGDSAQIPHFDEIAQEMGQQFPHILGVRQEQAGENYDPDNSAEAKLFDILSEGMPHRMTRREALDKAMGLLQEGHGEIPFGEGEKPSQQEIDQFRSYLSDQGEDVAFYSDEEIGRMIQGDKGEKQEKKEPKGETVPFSLDLRIYVRSFRQVQKAEGVAEPLPEEEGSNTDIQEFRTFLEDLGHDVSEIDDADLSVALQGDASADPAVESGELSLDEEGQEPDELALAEGVAFEMQHVTDQELAEEIARDHLLENPSYYKELAAEEVGPTVEQPSAETQMPDAQATGTAAPAVVEKSGNSYEAWTVARLNQGRGPNDPEAYYDEVEDRIRFRGLGGMPLPSDNSDEDDGDLFVRKAGNPSQSRGQPDNSGKFGPGGSGAKGDKPAQGGQSGNAAQQTEGDSAPPAGPTQGAGQEPPAAIAPEVQEPVDAGDGVLMSPEDREAFAAASEAIFPGKNFRPADIIAMSGAPEGMQVCIGIREKNGSPVIAMEGRHEKVQKFSRAFMVDANGKSYVKNDVFRLKPEHRAGGLGREIFSNQVSELVSREIGRIDTVAERYDSEIPEEKSIGYSYWPMLGYDGAIPLNLKQSLPPELASANTLSELYDTPGGKEWWIENGDSVKLSFDLSPRSDSIKKLNSYLISKGQRPIAQPRPVAEPPVTTRKNREDRLARHTQGLRERTAVGKSEGSHWELYRSAWAIMAEDVLLPVYGTEITKSVCEWAEEKSLIDTKDPQRAFIDAYRQALGNEIGTQDAQDKFMEMGQEVLYLTKRYDGDYPEEASTSRIGRRDDESLDFRVARQGYSIERPGHYTPCGRTARMLSPGVYRCFTDMAGNAHFVRKEIEVDELIRFPDSTAAHIISEIERFWGMEAQFKKYGFLFRRGCIMWGRAGNGKSATVNQIMEDVVAKGDITFLTKNPSDMITCLSQMREIEPERKCLVVMEDLDTIIRRHGEDDLLNWLDGQMSVDKLFVLATTNFPEQLPQRLISRPRRFDMVIEIKSPDAKMRDAYFARKVPDLPAAERHEWVVLTDGLPFASLAECVISVMCLGHSIDDTVERLRILDGPPPNSSRYDKRGVFGNGRE